jgi:spore germination protein
VIPLKDVNGYVDRVHVETLSNTRRRGPTCWSRSTGRTYSPAALAVVAAFLLFAASAVMLTTVDPAAAASNRGWQVSAWTFGDRGSLRRAVAAGSIDEVQPNWYRVRSDGSLVSDSVDPVFVQHAHALELRVLATVTNFGISDFDPAVAHTILNSPTARAELVDQLIQACAAIGYDGVDFDFESVPAADRDLLSSFVEQLADGLHVRGLEMAMAVTAKTSEPGGWFGVQSEDYARIGAAVDEFQIMTYGLHGSWSKPGPIAPPAWAAKVIRFAETKVDPAKIWMGVPFYGGEWWPGGSAQRTWKAFARRLASHRARVTRTASGEAQFTYQDAAGRRHKVFFQDRMAIAAKLEVIRTQHPEIAGVAIWAMGGENPRFWPLIAAHLSARRPSTIPRTYGLGSARFVRREPSLADTWRRPF